MILKTLGCDAAMLNYDVTFNFPAFTVTVAKFYVNGLFIS